MKWWCSDRGFQQQSFPPRQWVHGAWVHGAWVHGALGHGAIRYLRVSFPLVRHSRVGGNHHSHSTGFPPARERLVYWIPACAGTTYALESHLRGNDLYVAHCVAHGAIHLCLPTDFVFC